MLLKGSLFIGVPFNFFSLSLFFCNLAPRYDVYFLIRCDSYEKQVFTALSGSFLRGFSFLCH